MNNSRNIRNSLNTALTHIATIGFLGFVPFAPGTAGSLFALFLFLLADLSLYEHLFFIIIGTLLGTYAATTAEKTLNEKDSKKIIIDEFIGFYVSVFSLPKTWGFAVTAFLLFRFFDILKPLFITRIEKSFRSGFGVMADDIVAGIYANIVLQIWIIAFKT